MKKEDPQGSETNPKSLGARSKALSLMSEKINDLTTLPQDLFNINANMYNSINSDILNYL